MGFSIKMKRKRLTIEDGHLKCEDRVIAEWRELDQKVRTCMLNLGEYGYVTQGKFKCDISKKTRTCPLYQGRCTRLKYTSISYI